MFAVTSPTNHVLRVCSRCLYLLTWPSGTVSVNASMNECLQGQIVGELKGQISRSRGCRISLPTNNPLPRVIFWRTKEVCRHLFGSSYSCYGTNADSLPRRYLVVGPLTAIDHHNARGPILCSMSQTMMVTYPRSSASHGCWPKLSSHGLFLCMQPQRSTAHHGPLSSPPSHGRRNNGSITLWSHPVITARASPVGLWSLEDQIPVGCACIALSSFSCLQASNICGLDTWRLRPSQAIDFECRDGDRDITVVDHHGSRVHIVTYALELDLLSCRSHQSPLYHLIGSGLFQRIPFVQSGTSH